MTARSNTENDVAGKINRKQTYSLPFFAATALLAGEINGAECTTR
jgi:hypothetical protein